MFTIASAKIFGILTEKLSTAKDIPNTIVEKILNLFEKYYFEKDIVPRLKYEL